MVSSVSWLSRSWSFSPGARYVPPDARAVQQRRLSAVKAFVAAPRRHELHRRGVRRRREGKEQVHRRDSAPFRRCPAGGFVPARHRSVFEPRLPRTYLLSRQAAVLPLLPCSLVIQSEFREPRRGRKKKTRLLSHQGGRWHLAAVPQRGHRVDAGSRSEGKR